MTAAAEIAAALAGRPVRPVADNNFLVTCPAHDDRQPSLSIKDGDQGLLVRCFAGCEARDVLAALRHRGLMAGHGERPRRQREPAPTMSRGGDDYERRQRETAAWLWSQRRPIAGTVAERYLREVRGITGPLPATLGFLPTRRNYPPTLIAAFALAEEIEPGVLDVPRDVDAVHLVRLRYDGSSKAAEPSKISVGRPLGRPIVVAPINDGLALAICEGIEDALSVHAATGLGAWAAGSASLMPALAGNVPDYVEAVTIYAHDDDNDAGQRSAHALADALIERGIEVLIEGPR